MIRLLSSFLGATTTTETNMSMEGAEIEQDCEKQEMREIYCNNPQRLESISILTTLWHSQTSFSASVVSPCVTSAIDCILNLPKPENTIVLHIQCILQSSENELCWNILSQLHSKLHPENQPLSLQDLPIIHFDKELSVANIIDCVHMISKEREGIQTNANIILVYQDLQDLHIDHAGDVLTSLIKAFELYQMRNYTQKSNFTFSHVFVSNCYVDVRNSLTTFNCYNRIHSPFEIIQRNNREIIPIFFAQWTQSEISQCLELDLQRSQLPQGLDNCNNLVDIFVNTFVHKCRDVFALKQYFRALLQHLRGLQSFDQAKLIQLIKQMHSDLRSKSFLSLNWAEPQKNVLDLQLPLVSKQLLVASFIASFVPEKLDARLFSHTNSSKRQKSKKQTSSAHFLHLGPQFVSLQRLLAVYVTVFESSRTERLPYTQISSLVESNLLTTKTPSSKENRALFSAGLLARSDEGFDSMMLCCNLSFETVSRIAHNLRFPEFDEYLAFVHDH